MRKLRDNLTRFLIWLLQKVDGVKLEQEDLDRFGIKYKLEAQEQAQIVSPSKKANLSKFLNSFK